MYITMSTNNASSLSNSSVINRAQMRDSEACSNSRCISNIIDQIDEGKGSTNILEKIHVLPVSREAPRENVTGALLELMKAKTVVRQYMRIEVKVNNLVDTVNEDAVSDIIEASSYVVTYIVVECQPSLGYVDSTTIIYTQGNPLQPLKRVQILALVHPNSSYSKNSGFLSHMQFYYSGIPYSGGDDGATDSSLVSTSNETRAGTFVESYISNSSSSERYSMLGRSSPRPLQRPEDILNLILDDSSDVASEQSDSENQHAPAFRLSYNNDINHNTESSNRMVQLNFRLSQHVLNREPSSNGTIHNDKSEESKIGASVPAVNESTLFHEYIAPYLRSKQSITPVCHSQNNIVVNRDTSGTEIGAAVVLYPGRKLIIRDITFVVWATDPNNGPGYLDQDTLIYVSLDPWGEYRRVHIIPFADTLPTTYSYDLFEDYIRPYLLENPWKLVHKGDIFSFRGVEFKVIATEPSSVPAARIGPETVIHFEGSINPSILDILPTDLLARVRRLPARLQPFAIIAAAQSLDPQLLMRILPNGSIRNASRGMEESMVDLIKQKWVQPFNFDSYFKAYPELCSPRQIADCKSAKLLDAEIYDDRLNEARKNYSAGPSTFGKAVEFLFFNQPENFNVKKNINDFDPPCCTVCTLQLSDGDESITFPCGHPFHWKCVYSWLRCSNTCPNCRSNICDVVSNDGANSNNMIDPVDNQGAIAYLRQLVGEFFS